MKTSLLAKITFAGALVTGGAAFAANATAHNSADPVVPANTTDTTVSPFAIVEEFDFDESSVEDIELAENDLDESDLDNLEAEDADDGEADDVDENEVEDGDENEVEDGDDNEVDDNDSNDTDTDENDVEDGE